MSRPEQRQTLLGLMQEAGTVGAARARACAQIGLSQRTMPRWQHPQSQTERQAALAMLNGEEFKNLPPSQIVPRLADQGRYIASESTFYRLMHQAGQMTELVHWYNNEHRHSAISFVTPGQRHAGQDRSPSTQTPLKPTTLKPSKKQPHSPTKCGI